MAASIAKYANSYKSVAVTTATRGQLVLMLFDGALRFLSTATHGFAETNIGTRNEQIHNNLLKTQNILRELQGSLDMQAGGEFSTRMHALYEWMLGQLQTANLKKEQSLIPPVETLLGEVRDAWAQMIQTA